MSFLRSVKAFCGIFSYIPLLSSMNHTPIMHHLISLSLDYLRYLGYDCGLYQHFQFLDIFKSLHYVCYLWQLPSTSLAHFGSLRLFNYGRFWLYCYFCSSSRSEFPKTHSKVAECLLCIYLLLYQFFKNNIVLSYSNRATHFS